ncbi:MAG: FAD-dependent thymidylate synthase [Syntrophus sp. SKADARSKE-3]|nr:FAD-dependent thymidylate synthase [Syntrophus sp. SKADARSKE-3]
MKVILAGYNIDYDLIQDIEDALPDMDILTPETIAAAYARISRSPKPVDELRAGARAEVDKARQSNQNIVFGMGHSSIAEHAVFNIDILGVSRLLVEEIEKFRLCSYTEKSQRYVLFKDDAVLPEEIRVVGLEAPYMDTIRVQNRFYQECYEKLRPYIFKQHQDLAADPAMRSTLEGWAKEDARYAIALATETQLGMTINARNLELMLRRLAALPLTEAQSFSQALFKATRHVAPSLIRYTEATSYDRLTRQTLKDAAAELTQPTLSKDEDEDVRLVWASPDADNRIVAFLLHSSTNRCLTDCLKMASTMTEKEREGFVKTALRHIQAYDQVLREFEHIDLLFELTISASCFAQLKRHRMSTLTGQDYDPTLGVTMPSVMTTIGMEKPFMDVMAQSEAMYERIKKAAAPCAAYILTNAHRRRVAFKVNARELYHISRLRSDVHAQWDIRQVADKMLALGRQAMPLTLILAAGKDGFRNRYETVFP